MRTYLNILNIPMGLEMPPQIILRSRNGQSTDEDRIRRSPNAECPLEALRTFSLSIVSDTKISPGDGDTAFTEFGEGACGVGRAGEDDLGEASASAFGIHSYLWIES